MPQVTSFSSAIPLSRGHQFGSHIKSIPATPSRAIGATTLQRTNTDRRHRTRNAYWKPVTLSVLIVLNVVLAGMYIVTLNADSVRGYAVTKLKTELANLTEQHQELNIKSASLSTINSPLDAGLSNFVPVVEAEFINAGSGKLVQR